MAGRLVEAWGAGHHYSYDFTSTANASFPSGTQLAAVGSAAVSNIQYDGNGNTTQYTAGGATTYLSWGGVNRNIAVRATRPVPADVSYIRFPSNRRGVSLS